MLHDFVINQVLRLCLLELHVIVSDIGLVFVPSVVLLAHYRLHTTNFLSVHQRKDDQIAIQEKRQG